MIALTTGHAMVVFTRPGHFGHSMLDVSMLRQTLKRGLYASGALGAWHRHRNRDRLTAVAFHRVLPRSDPRFATSDPEYTLPLDVFEECLAFFRRHYHVVSFADVLRARRGEHRLPERPLLITFDDGWRDNVEYALPALRAARMPSVLFVAGAAVDRGTPFWQEQLVAAWRSGRLDAARARQLLHAAGAREAIDGDPLAPVRAGITALEALAPEARDRLLAGDILAGEPHSMITSDDLRTLADAGVAIGAHGFSHAPLPTVDARAELAATRALLQARLHPHVDVPALAFPHGKFDETTVAGARELGFELLFTSARELVSAHAAGPGLIGRVGFSAPSLADDAGAFCPERLALQLFRAPHAAMG
jgi:peptidoglycan/xylan/chitin deacetylase (PgdA/CDA1 family)